MITNVSCGIWLSLKSNPDFGGKMSVTVPFNANKLGCRDGSLNEIYFSFNFVGYSSSSGIVFLKTSTTTKTNNAKKLQAMAPQVRLNEVAMIYEFPL